MQFRARVREEQRCDSFPALRRIEERTTLFGCPIVVELLGATQLSVRLFAAREARSVNVRA